MTTRIAVVGGGTMGVGIAYVSALAGGTVHVVEPDNRRAEAMQRRCRRQSLRAVQRGKLDEPAGAELSSKITRHKSVNEIPSGCDVVIETVPERLALKLEVLAQIADRATCRDRSNTSALSIDRLRKRSRTRHVFLGMHFFQPGMVVPARGARAGRAYFAGVLESARRFVTWLGKDRSPSAMYPASRPAAST